MNDTHDILENMDDIIWTPESSIQEFYSEVMFTGHYGFYHKGHEYFVTWDHDVNGKEIFVIYDRDLNNPLFSEKSSWDIEPRMDYPSLPDLCFCFELKNEKRTISEYICDYNGIPRIMFPEPLDKHFLRKL